MTKRTPTILTLSGIDKSLIVILQILKRMEQSTKFSNDYKNANNYQKINQLIQKVRDEMR